MITNLNMAFGSDNAQANSSENGMEVRHDHPLNNNSTSLISSVYPDKILIKRWLTKLQQKRDGISCCGTKGHMPHGYGARGPVYLHVLALISPWISNYIHYKVWDEIIYPSPNCNSATFEVWEGISNFISHITGHMITYPCWY